MGGTTSVNFRAWEINIRITLMNEIISITDGKISNERRQ